MIRRCDFRLGTFNNGAQRNACEAKLLNLHCLGIFLHIIKICIFALPFSPCYPSPSFSLGGGSAKPHRLDTSRIVAELPHLWRWRWPQEWGPWKPVAHVAGSPPIPITAPPASSPHYSVSMVLRAPSSQHRACMPRGGGMPSPLPGRPRRGWAAWDVSGTHHFSKSKFSFFRLKQMSASLHVRARCLAFPCSPAGAARSKSGQALLAMHL